MSQKKPLRNLLRVYLQALLIFLLAGCAAPLHRGEIADLQRLPQDALYYVSPESADDPLLEPERQRAEARLFLEQFFSPWQAEAAPPSAEKVFAALTRLFSGPIYGMNLRPYSEQAKIALATNCNRARYPRQSQRAITVRDTHIRSLPTSQPGFSDPDKAGEGYPFDYFQYSALRANTPLRILHRSLDEAWCLVQAPHVTGWLPTTDLAPVDDPFIARFQTGSYLAVVQEGVPVHDASGTFRQKVSIGALLPLERASEARWEVLIAVPDVDGKAVIRSGFLPRPAAAPWPQPATPRTLAVLANQLLGQSYGWGGLHGGRDCSATLQDLFAPIGLALPRNSARQIERGRTITLQGLSFAEKEQYLRTQGRPFITLIGAPGHIMLYLGQREGESVVLHTLWGLRTRTAGGREGRHLLGKTVITTLRAGQERPDLARPEGVLLWRVNAMSLLEETTPMGPP